MADSATSMEGLTHEDRLNTPLDDLIKRNRQNRKKAQTKQKNKKLDSLRGISTVSFPQTSSPSTSSSSGPAQRFRRPRGPNPAGRGGSARPAAARPNTISTPKAPLPTLTISIVNDGASGSAKPAIPTPSVQPKIKKPRKRPSVKTVRSVATRPAGGQQTGRKQAATQTGIPTSTAPALTLDQRFSQTKKPVQQQIIKPGGGGGGRGKSKGGQPFIRKP